MPYRWVSGPVVFRGDTRYPKCATLIDPGVQSWIEEGKTILPYYHHSSTTNGDDAMSLVWGVDLSGLDADPDIVSLSDDIPDDGLDAAYSAPPSSGARERMTAEAVKRNAPSPPPADDVAFEHHLKRVMQTVNPTADPRKTIVLPSRDRLSKRI